MFGLGNLFGLLPLALSLPLFELEGAGSWAAQTLAHKTVKRSWFLEKLLSSFYSDNDVLCAPIGNI